MSRRKNKSEPWRDDALEAVRNLRAGNVIVHASDTVWGIACDSTNPAAVKKLRKLKNRSEATPILILVSEEGQIEKHFEKVPDAVWDLFEHNDRPTTVVMPGGKGVDKSILAEDGSLGVRLVRDPWIEFVANGLGRPIASTSANISGSATPSNFDAIDSEILEGADFVSSHRRIDRTVNTSSFIVSFDASERFKILRD
jgi:L-threonylcarbamoyladenylate synthase